ncbi:hypothetical protein QTH97_10590 [Variovorax sp. J22R24]|uniref:B12-binding domain-containing radical SAM protein n=1 Tax=Variovorax gracilis TaxID=3053502 RepID=UPI002576CDD1|nr:hypothetical protein [Variovorax sp. J22R24]MDM0105381.1 hypothetical protein [Variovorax sp. J22R24]
MQPITGLHIGSLLDQTLFEVRLYHEDWHGPFDPADSPGYDLVFLTGLQPDFDRMRQLSYYFRAQGAVVVGGGSICTAFPEFATEFFDVVCAGGVDCVRDVASDFLRGSLQKIYRSPAASISDYPVDYSLFTRHGINPMLHLMETSRGCSFKCSFCVMPNEVGGHATYSIDHFKTGLQDTLASSAPWSFKRWYPLVMLLDNNFSDDPAHMLKVAAILAANPKVRGWAALVTQNVLQDRDLIAHLARSKCILLFAGVESLDREMLRRYNKKQNLSRRHSVVDDIAFAEGQGIAICYGYLFDHRHQTAAEMEEQIRALARNPLMPMPVYLSVIAPLAGTATFWDDLRLGHLRPNLRMRDLDGETMAHVQLGDRPEVLVDFIERMFRRPWTVVSRLLILAKTIRRIVHAKTLNPIRWYVIASANFHCFIWSRATPAQPRTYLAGTDTLDPQYFERPADLSDEDERRYFDPIELTDDDGKPSAWLTPYIPSSAGRQERPIFFAPPPIEAEEQQP